VKPSEERIADSTEVISRWIINLAICLVASVAVLIVTLVLIAAVIVRMLA